MKRLYSFLLLCFLVLVSCGGSSKDGKEQLMVYTSMKEVIIGKIRDEFTAKYPNIEFDYYSAGAGKLMAKIAAERESGQLSVDVLWTSEIPDFYSLKEEGVLEPYASPELPNVVSPVEDPDNAFSPARLGTLGIVYNTTKIKNPPTSWEDLLKPEYKNGFAIANPALSGTAMVSIALIEKNMGWDYINKLKQNGAKMGQGSGQKDKFLAAIRPMDVDISKTKSEKSIEGKIERTSLLGAIIDYKINIDENISVRSQIQTEEAHQNDYIFKEGENCFIIFNDIIFYENDDEIEKEIF